MLKGFILTGLFVVVMFSLSCNQSSGHDYVDVCETLGYSVCDRVFACNMNKESTTIKDCYKETNVKCENNAGSNASSAYDENHVNECASAKEAMKCDDLNKFLATRNIAALPESCHDVSDTMK